MASQTDRLPQAHHSTEPLLIVACVLCGVLFAYAMSHVTGSRPLQFGVFVGVGVFVPRLLTAPVRW